MLMDNLPRLRREPIATKLAVYRKVGGHPKSIELLEGWLASGTVTDLLADPSLDGMLAQQWADYFLRALLAQLTAAQRDALARLCIFETSLDQDAFDYAAIKPEWVRRWLDLSLVQTRRAAACPIFRPRCMPVWEMLPESEKRKLDAAGGVHDASCGAGVPAGRRRRTKDEGRTNGPRRSTAGRSWRWRDKLRAQSGRERGRRSKSSRWPAATRAWWAGWWPAPTTWPRPAPRWAAPWRGSDHLFAAGEYEPAGEIVTAVYDILDRWGSATAPRRCCRRASPRWKACNKAVAQGNLATLLMDEGKLAEALATYEAVYRTFEAMGARQQMAAVLNCRARSTRSWASYDKAIEKARSAAWR